MKGHEGFSLPEVILGILFLMLKNDLRTLLVCLRSFSEYFFMLENGLRTLTGCEGFSLPEVILGILFYA